MATNQHKDFSCIGGLDKHIRIVKEMVLFPLMYGEIYSKFHLRPPRGLLFYGPPGTGKTLVASALAGECSNSERKVHFISRKGSDCLSKWVGESEKKLQKIFQMAQQSKPCIIFFDEVDGLAPVRSSRQDFVHASIVSTLLALMDGLDNNSEIIVIGATNRLDAIDPALRRPGRFDRELYFPLPCFSARKEILSVHVKNWNKKPTQKFISLLASKTIGFCGSDLQALCAEAVMVCVRRNYPHIYSSKSKPININEKSLKIENSDFLQARKNIVPASHRIYVAPVKSLSSDVSPLLQNNFNTIITRINLISPAEMIASSDDTINKRTSHSSNCPRILLCGTDDCHTRHLGPAILHTLEHLPCHILDVTSLFEETLRAAEESIIQKVRTARHTLPSLLYIPDILSWWDLVDEAARVVFTSLMKSLDHNVHILILITAKCNQKELPSEILEIFNEQQNEIFEIQVPTKIERENYFKEFFLRINLGSDNLSNKSSLGDITESMTPKKGKDNRTRKQGYGGKRELGSSCGEGPLHKRQRVSGASSANHLKNSRSYDKLTEPQMQDLLRRVIALTDGWKCSQLESFKSCLKRACETAEASNIDDIYAPLIDCITNATSSINLLFSSLKSEPVTHSNIEEMPMCF